MISTLKNMHDIKETWTILNKMLMGRKSNFFLNVLIFCLKFLSTKNNEQIHILFKKFSCSLLHGTCSLLHGTCPLLHGTCPPMSCALPFHRYPLAGAIEVGICPHLVS